MSRLRSLLLLLFTAAATVAAQTLYMEEDKCGPLDTLSEASKLAASGNWGYGYDTLLYDLSQWKKSPFVTVDSVGASVQGRALWVLTIQDTSADPDNKRQRVWVHARTHPNEVQGTWVTNEMIAQLLGANDTAAQLRRRYVFVIMPMYNPDGVELGLARQNANNIDIESNWNSASPQKEVLVLRSQFIAQMAKPNPMRIMLNMHSAYACTRYFVYHAPGGTSPLFAQMEQRFINYVRSFFPDSIRPYPYYTSWVNAPATQYPESWCWSNHKEKIMAMTYEDGNCAAATMFDRTARAILRGIDSFLQDSSAYTGVLAARTIPKDLFLLRNHPNPFNPSTTISYRLPEAAEVTLSVYDLLGREAATLVRGREDAGGHAVPFNAAGLSSGLFIVRLTAGGHSEFTAMQFIK
ncbi:MAG: T9SS type A sorting domain-containing protein [Bacteroidetes bacterium]|nr:T9SS type A sorting domain-containing protein [Bacteroidota bacterium]